jgi:hypothetical protein
MEAIKAIAKRTKTGKYKIDLPDNITDDEVEVMLQIIKPKIKKTTADFAGKMKWKGDALAYQKEIRDEWN